MATVRCHSDLPRVPLMPERCSAMRQVRLIRNVAATNGCAVSGCLWLRMVCITARTAETIPCTGSKASNVSPSCADAATASHLPHGSTGHPHQRHALITRLLGGGGERFLRRNACP